MPNRLAAEASPYLLQHAQNPVDWYPWGPEAFDRAHRENRPIFLSIGYSTCHWCHVMEHESFESTEIAELLNRDFVSIKVDREERPDVDRVYMTFVQATTGAGGWPMSVWLTPDLKPFFGGTYFPPTSRWGRPGFADVLQEIARLWRAEPDRVWRSAEALTTRLREASQTATGGDVAGVDALTEGVRQFQATFDGRHGGFGDAPKFPRPSELLFLLREHARTGDEAARDMTLRTLRSMALGGMRDHTGGGFHRYSVDAEWRVPHFEKMLYDQAQLALAYLEAAQVSGDAFYAAVADDTLEYVRREMTGSHGGFYSAEDADSVPPEHAADPQARKTEGAFYLWTDEEIGTLLGQDAGIVRRRFGIRPGGNAPHDPQGEFTGKNLLYVAKSSEEVAAEVGATVEAVDRALARARLAMFEARLGRPRPHLDDKILTAWNGLMIAAFARAARVLSVPAGGEGEAAQARGDAHLATARAAALFVKDRMWDARHDTLFRRFRADQTAIHAYAEDYACLIFGLLELFQADSNPSWLEWALTLQALQDRRFWDEVDGGWFSTTGQDRSVLLRLKETYDGAEPSATSVSTMNLLTLAHLAGAPEHFDKVERALRSFGPRLGQFARAVPMMMAALSMFHAGSRQVVIVGQRGTEETRAFEAALARHFLPGAVTVAVEPGAHQSELARSMPFVASLASVGGKTTAYVCRGFVCERPVTDPGEMMDRLAAAKLV